MLARRKINNKKEYTHTNNDTTVQGTSEYTPHVHHVHHLKSHFYMIIVIVISKSKTIIFSHK